MNATTRAFEVEELDSPIQRIVIRQKRFSLTPQIAVGLSGLTVCWEIVRQNLPPEVAKAWPWRLELLDLQSGTTVLTVFLAILFTRMQYAETIRPAIGWTFGIPPSRANLPLPAKRNGRDLLAVNVFNGGGGRAVLLSVQYRFALTHEEHPSNWILHGELMRMLGARELKAGKDFHFSHMRPGSPLMPGQSELDKGAFVLLTTRAVMRKFRILDIKLRFRDSLGDVHERILPCRYVIDSELE